MTALSDLRAITGDEAMIKACGNEIEQLSDQIKDLRALRNEGIRRLVKKHGRAKVARMAGMSVSGINWIKEQGSAL